MKIYFVVINDQQQGPYTLEELRGLGIGRHTLVWVNGMPNWVPAGQLPELDAILPPVVLAMHPIVGHKHLPDTYIPTPDEMDTSHVKPKRVRLMLLAFVIVVAAVGVAMFLFQKQASSPAVQEDGRTKDSLLRKKSEAELREQLKAI